MLLYSLCIFGVAGGSGGGDLFSAALWFSLVVGYCCTHGISGVETNICFLFINKIHTCIC